MNTLHPDISDTCTQADKLLWDAYARSAGNQPGVSGNGRLVFPGYRDEEKLRVSEQEARFAFVEALCRGPLRYSVEVPTTKLYSFDGKGSRSALTDLQMHESNEAGICNVEFKAGGKSPDAKDNNSIRKDVEKLLLEPVWGLWFHILEGVNSSTINKLMCVMASCISQVQDEPKNDIMTPGLTLHICVLRHGFSLQKDVLFSKNDTELIKHLNVDLCVSRDKLKDVKDLNGWNLERESRQ